MAHRDDMNPYSDPTHQVASARTSSYLKAGAKLEGNESYDAFLAKTGLGFQVRTEDVRAAGTGLIVPGVKCVEKIVDNGINQPIANVSVGGRMALIQNRAAFAPVGALVDRGQATYVAGGTFKGGAIGWALADLGIDREVTRLDGSADPISLKLLARNAHDGSSNLIWGLAPIRFFCTNQLNGLMKGLQMEVRIRHTKSGAEDVERMGKYLTTLVSNFDRSVEVWQGLARQRMTTMEFAEFAHDFLVELYGEFPNGTDEKSEKIRAKRQKQAEELIGYFQTGKGNTGETVWDAYNGVSEWIEHRREEYAASKWTAKQWETHAQSQGFGEGRNRRTKALRLLTR